MFLGRDAVRFPRCLAGMADIISNAADGSRLSSTSLAEDVHHQLDDAPAEGQDALDGGDVPRALERDDFHRPGAAGDAVAAPELMARIVGHEPAGLPVLADTHRPDIAVLAARNAMAFRPAEHLPGKGTVLLAGERSAQREVQDEPRGRHLPVPCEAGLVPGKNRDDIG